MHFLWQGVKDGFRLVDHGNPYILHLLDVTLEVAAVSTVIALVLGLPLGLAIGLQRRRRGLRWAVTLGNAGLGLPPVLVGLVLALLMFPGAPLGGLHLLYTIRAVYIAQTILGLPIVVALTASAVRSLPPGLTDQARLFGASTGQVWLLTLREARVGVLTAVIAALGSALSEVGAVVLVGGNLYGSTQTLASATLEAVDGGAYAEAMAIGMVLVGLILVLAAALTVVQLRGSPSPSRPSPRARVA
jgi:tungstate transport system permease protein